MLKHTLTLLCTLLFTACATPAKYTPAQYNGSNEIYPAVIGAFNDIRAKMEKIDVVNNSYLSGFIHDISGEYKYKVRIDFSNNQLTTRLTEIHKKDFNTHKWKPDNYAAYSFNNNIFRNKLAAAILHILSNQALYESIKNSITQNLGFHYIVMKSMSDHDIKRWIEHKMKNQIYNIRLTNEDTVFLMNSSHKTAKKFIAHLNYDSHKNSQNELPFTAEFDLDLHTNNESYKMLKPGDILNTKAKIVDASVHVYITTFGLSLDEQN